MSAERDGRRVSSVLTEARTVHSRAKTSLERFRWIRNQGDPAAAEIEAALRKVVELLEPFQRTGRAPR